MNKNKPLKIALFTDGRPGHEKQSNGIISQLKKMTRVEVVTHPVEKPNLLRHLIGYFALFLGNFRTPVEISDCDILIGTGTHTHLPMLTAKKKHGMAVVTCMTPGKILINQFDLIFAPFHDNPDEDKENIISTIGPPNENENLGMHSNENVLILVGGTDPKYLRWNQDKIKDYVQSIISVDSHKAYIISSSPRTPGQTEDMLEEVSDKNKNVQFYKFKDTEKGWVETQYSRCATVWVTGDSISMVYEALSSGCRVGVIPVDWLKEESKFSRSEKHLRDNGLVMDVERYLNGDREKLVVSELQVARKCAEEILRRFG